MNGIAKKYFLLLPLGLSLLLIGLYLYNKKVPTLENVNADYRLSADQLYDAFQIDEIEAAQLYLDKVILVEGVIASIKEGSNQNNVILEAKESMIGGVNCSLGEDVKSLKPGDNVKIKGSCKGFLMSVILNNCYVEK